MVQILPRFDPGGEIGRAFGGGAGEQLGIQADRNRILSGLDNLKNLNLEKSSAGDIIKNLAQSFAGVPGGMQVLQEILPTLLSQRQSYGYGESLGGQYPGSRQAGGSIDLDETSQLINKEGSPESFQENIQADISGGPRSNLAPNLQKVPGLEEDIPAYQPMSRQERQQFARNMAAAGSKPNEIQQALNLEEDRRYKVWQSLVDAKKARTEQFREERGLENEQRNFIKDSLATELNVPAENLDPYEIQKGYEFFKRYQENALKNNKNLTDQQLWNLARKDFNMMRESFDSAKEKLTRPGLFAGDYKNRLKIAKDWAQKHLKTYGNFKQDRDKIVSMLTQNGYTLPEAQSIVRPMKPQLEKAISGTPPIRDILKIRGGPGQSLRRERISPDKQNEYFDKLADNIAKSLGNNDSILLLRENLVRKKGLTEEEFQEVLSNAEGKMEEMGKSLSPEQKEEIPHLRNRVRPSLYEILFESGFDLRKEFPRLAE